MRKLLLALPLVLAGCATTTSPGTSTNPLVQDVINATVKYCKFAPNVESVVNILAAGFGGNPLVVGASSVIDAISQAMCGAMTGHAGTAHIARVGGVRVTGHFIR